MTTVTTTALQPSTPLFAVERPTLVEQLEQALVRPVVLLVAPAGYGKSVLLAQWAAAHPERRVAWMTTRGIGGDAISVGRRLCAALALADEDLGRRLGRHLGTADELGELFVDHVLAQLALSPELVLVIEDLEGVTSAPLLVELGGLAERLPPNVRLVLASRRDPSTGFHRLRLRDELAEVRQDQLAMSGEEARAVVVRLAACELREDQLQGLVARTEGWPAGVQLAALSLRDRDDVDAYLEDLSGDDRHIADYLSDEILAGLDPDERDFLVQTSVLDQVTGPLCDALTGRGDGQAVLESLHRRSLFLTSVDQRRTWFRYHPLFRDLLRYELRTVRPGDEDALNRAAATWLLEAGLPAAAAEHLRAAGDHEGVIALADQEGRAFFERGEAHVILGWLADLPRELVDARPRVALSIAMLQLIAGQSLASQDRAERTGLLFPDDPVVQAMVDTIRVNLVYHHVDPASVLAASERLLDVLDTRDTRPVPVLAGLTEPQDLQVMARGSAGRAHLLSGELGPARASLADAAGRTTFPPLVAHLHGSIALVEALAGRLAVAAEAATRILAVADELGMSRHPACADAHLALAHVLTQRGDPLAAEPHLGRALAFAQSNRRHALIAMHRAEWAEWYLATGRVEALAQVGAAQPTGEPPLPDGVRARLAAVHARLLLGAGRVDRALAVLEAHPGPRTADVASAEAAVAVAAADDGALHKVLDGWPEHDADEPVSTLQRDLYTVLLLDRDGGRLAADELLVDLLVRTEVDGHLLLFRLGGRSFTRILRRRYGQDPSPHLRRVLESLGDLEVEDRSDELYEQLSERELEVLRYLPTRMSNADIAAQLFVSVNTLKTHLKAVYRKLGVANRAEAVERADDLDLA